MAKRLSVKFRKHRRNLARAYKTESTPKRHKIAEERSRKAKLKKAFPMY